MNTIRPETPADFAAIGELQLEAFADPRLPPLVEALRAADSALPTQSFVAVDGQRIVGHTMLSAARLDAPRRLVDVYVLSPLGVLPQRQRQGIGASLIEHALLAAERSGVPLVFLEGDPTYYRKHGFQQASALGFRAPSLRIPDPAFQVVPLSAHEPWMTGTLVYPDIFWSLDCVGLRDPDA